MKKEILEQATFDFFFESGSKLEAKQVVMPDAKIVFYAHAFSQQESDEIFRELLKDIEWQQDTIKYYGKEIPLPRLTAWYGDKGTSYTYSRIAMQPKPWSPRLLQIKQRVESFCNAQFNSVLLNLYRNGKDRVSWHQDNEPELGENPVIASLSFGETRSFQFRHKFKKDIEKFEVLLTHGSLLIMKGLTQKCWQHQIPRTSRPIGQRINLTFRFIH